MKKLKTTKDLHKLALATGAEVVMPHGRRFNSGRTRLMAPKPPVGDTNFSEAGGVGDTRSPASMSPTDEGEAE